MKYRRKTNRCEKNLKETPYIKDGGGNRKSRGKIAYQKRYKEIED